MHRNPYDSKEDEPRKGTLRRSRALTEEITSNPFFLGVAVIAVVLVVLLLIAVFIR